MRIGAMLGDISRSFFKRPVTERYPFERRPTPERLRGQLQFDAAKCTGCKICMRDCPAIALELVVVDKATKRFAMKFHSDRCTYCAQCVVSCNFDSLSMTHEQWELAGLSRAQFLLTLGREEDLAVLRERAQAATAPAVGA
ncbi:MAG: 4Fe-4S dicluster domain-containing protein [Acidobacteria bacterium]|nr:MAG: 4Fe-4S dicluster domain-containing protein [Acidobacteriota bacterium]